MRFTHPPRLFCVRVEGSPQCSLGASFEEELSPKVTEVVAYQKQRTPPPCFGAGTAKTPYFAAMPLVPPFDTIKNVRAVCANAPVAVPSQPAGLLRERHRSTPS